MYGWPSSDRLNSAGRMSNVSAVLCLPALFLGILADKSDILLLELADLSLALALVWAGVVILRNLIDLLNGPLNFHGVDFYLKLLIGSTVLSGIYSVFDTMGIIDDRALFLIAVPWAFMNGLLCVIVGVKLRVVWSSLPSLKMFSVAQIILGTLAMSLIFILLALVATAVSGIVLAFVFWEAAERSSAGWFDPEAEDPAANVAATEF